MYLAEQGKKQSNDDNGNRYMTSQNTQVFGKDECSKGKILDTLGYGGSAGWGYCYRIEKWKRRERRLEDKAVWVWFFFKYTGIKICTATVNKQQSDNRHSF